MNTVYCYDRYSQHKRALGLLGAAGLSLALLLALGQSVTADAQPVVHKLPRVVVVGKSQATLAAERAQRLLSAAPSAAGAAQIVKLPRVVVEGQRSSVATLATRQQSLEGQRLAQGLPAALSN